MAKPSDQPLTAQEVRRLFHYDPDTGVFTRRVTLCGRAIAGQQVGSKHYRWGHLAVKIGPRQYTLHRLAWFYTHGEWPTSCIDHINGDQSDNRLCNLRLADSQLNAQNRHRPRSGSATGLLGVTKTTKGFQASIKSHGVKTHLGTFRTAEEAHFVYVAARNARYPECSVQVAI
jgi:hypothetical protein